MKLYLPTLIWSGLMLLITIQGWWASFGTRTGAHWTFVALLVIVLQAISVYMAAALVLPDVTGDAIVDLRDHYFAHRSWFFGALFAATVFSAAKDLALGGHLPDRINLGFHVIFGVSTITGAITRREWFHKLMALAFAMLFLLYIGPAVRTAVACNASPVARLRGSQGLSGKEHPNWLRALTPRHINAPAEYWPQKVWAVSSVNAAMQNYAIIYEHQTRSNPALAAVHGQAALLLRCDVPTYYVSQELLVAALRTELPLRLFAFEHFVRYLLGQPGHF